MCGKIMYPVTLIEQRVRSLGFSQILLFYSLMLKHPTICNFHTMYGHFKFINN